MNKQNIFIDSDIILDVLLEREGFYNDSARILDLGEKKEIKLFTSTIAISNIAYILRKELKNNKKVLDCIKSIIEIIKPLSVTENIIIKALETEFSDFEDSIQYITAKENRIDTLITRNKKDYKKADIRILTAKELFLDIIF